MRRFLRYILDRLPYVGRLRQQVRDAGEFPAGYYYSPIPNREEVAAYLAAPSYQQQADSRDEKSALPDIKLNRHGQFEYLQAFAHFYDEVPFPEQRHPDFRYYYQQDFFGYSDAIFLYSFLRKTKPKRIIEIGSGFSSAVILDTVEHFFDHQPEITFIEPYPERLGTLLKPHDKASVRIIEKKVQEVPLETFASLQAGDLLFIDSSHVIKFGSDVHFLLFEILPRMPAGIFVHFHDVFYPFEYPAEWLAAGRYWNEDYFLRAFLAYNSEWTICFFNGYVARAFEPFLAENMPLCLKNTGGSLYIQRVEKSRGDVPHHENERD